jgi:hypothetical protein
MATELYPGTLANFNGSMAKSIEDALAGLIGPLPSAPPAAVTDRRVLFIAIAEGVIRYLKQNEAAFTVTVDIGPSNVEVHPDIQVRF